MNRGIHFFSLIYRRSSTNFIRKRLVLEMKNTTHMVCQQCIDSAVDRARAVHDIHSFIHHSFSFVLRCEAVGRLVYYIFFLALMVKFSIFVNFIYHILHRYIKISPFCLSVVNFYCKSLSYVYNIHPHKIMDSSITTKGGIIEVIYIPVHTSQSKYITRPKFQGKYTWYNVLFVEYRNGNTFA